MGNTVSSTASQQAQQDTSRQGSKSWATTENQLSGPLSFLIKEQVQCLCEGGRKCSRENPACQKGPNAVTGLHSNWVGDHVLAMARPWQEHVVKYELVTKFQELNIGLILNLQEVGEHDSCGPGNLPASGFTYNPEPFMAAKINFCNTSWRDMGVPTLDRMMDIVQVMHYTTVVEKRKIAVHCHAGLGRTGLAIACFMVATGEATAAQAIQMVRHQRPGALQTNAQVVFVSVFEQYLQYLRCLFKVADTQKINLGNEGYILTKLSKKISRSMSAHGAAIIDPLAVATAALSSSGTAAVVGPNSAPLATASANGTPKAGSGLQSVADAQADWANASYEPMSAAEAAQVMSTAEAAANAMLNLKNSGASDGVMLHAKRLSGGGGSLKLVCNLKAIKEETDKPVHRIETETAVTEVYGDGLTIIRSAQSYKKLPAARPTSTEEQLRERLQPTIHELGLDKQNPWNEKFHIKPEHFSAEGWLPEAPTSYREALKRQQRLLHGMERRQSFNLHKLLKAAAKALTQAAAAYNAVPEHWDSSPVPSSAASQPGQLRRIHTRSRSSAAAELLAVTANLSLAGASNSGSHSQPSTPVKSLSSKTMGKAAAVAAAAAAVSGLWFLSGAGGAAGAASGASLVPSGIHLGAPGTSPCNSGANTRASSGNGAAGDANSHSNCLVGCCAPSFAAGLVTALVYEGRYPPEYEMQWSACPRMKVLGLTDGNNIVSQLHAVKLALNHGDYAPLGNTSAAVALLVLGNWFGQFKEEALTESSSQLLINEADALLDEAKAAAAASQRQASAETASRNLHKSAATSSFSSGCEAGAVRASPLHSPHQFPRLSLPKLAISDQGSSLSAAGSKGSVPDEADLAGLVDDDSLLARKASARAVCCALRPDEQALFLMFAAVLRHIRHASMDDSRLHSWMVERGGQQQEGEEYSPFQTLEPAAAATAGFGVSSSSGAQQLQQRGSHAIGLVQMPQQQTVDSEVDAAMTALYKLVARWLTSPLDVACSEVFQATAAFLQYLTVDDVAYSQLLFASRETGLKKSHSQPANHRADSPDSSVSNNGSVPSSPRGQLKAKFAMSAVGQGLLQSPGSTKGSPSSPLHGKAKSKLGLPHSASSPAVAQRGKTKSATGSPAVPPKKQEAAAAAPPHASCSGCSNAGCQQECADSNWFGALFGHKKSRRRLQLQEPGEKLDCQAQTGPSLAGGTDMQAQTGPSLWGSCAATGPESAAGSCVSIKESSSSHMVHPGQAELCVNRQKERCAAGPAADLVAELAHLNARQHQQQPLAQQQPRPQSPKPKDFFIEPDAQSCEHGSSRLTGALNSPPKSLSPAPPSSSRAGSSQPPKHHLPAIRPSVAGAAAVGMVMAASSAGGANSNSSSPASSAQFAPGQLGTNLHSTAPGVGLARQLSAQAELSASLQSAPGTAGSCSLTASFSTAYARGTAAAAAAAQGVACNTAGVSAVTSSIDVGASCQMLSVSAISDLQLPSFAASTCSIAHSVTED